MVFWGDGQKTKYIDLILSVQSSVRIQVKEQVILPFWTRPTMLIWTFQDTQVGEELPTSQGEEAAWISVEAGVCTEAFKNKWVCLWSQEGVGGGEWLKTGYKWKVRPGWKGPRMPCRSIDFPYLLSSFCVPGTVIGDKDSKVSSLLFLLYGFHLLKRMWY